MTLAVLEAAKRRVEEAERKLKLERDRIKRIEASMRVKQAKADRALDTRQKLLIGAYVLQKTGFNASEFALEHPDFVMWLTRDHDRAAFGFSPINPTSEKPE